MFRREVVAHVSNAEYNSFMNTILESVDNDINRYISNKEKLNDVVFMTESTDEEIALFEAENQNIVTKIGQAIIDFFKMIQKKFSELMDKFKSVIKKKDKETSDSELKKAMEEHPELAMSFYEGIRNGNIKLNEFKDINELLNTAEKLQKDLANGNIDDKTFSEKIDDALAAVEKKVKPIASILGSVTAIATAIGTIVHFRRKSINEYMQMHDNIAKYDEMVKTAMQNMDYDAQGDTSKHTYLSTSIKKQQEIHNYVYGKESALLSVIEKISNFMSKITPKSMKHTTSENIEKMRKKGKFPESINPDANKFAEIAGKLLSSGNANKLSNDDWDFYNKNKNTDWAQSIIKRMKNKGGNS